MTREELIKWLDDEIIHSAELCEDGDAKSWGYEEGILISRNEAEEIREFLSLPPAEGAGLTTRESLIKLIIDHSTGATDNIADGVWYKLLADEILKLQSIPINNGIPTRDKNPKGLHQRYIINKTNGEPVDEKAEYFVLRVDKGGNDSKHIAACRKAVIVYANAIKEHLPKLSEDLIARYSDESQPTAEGAELDHQHDHPLDHLEGAEEFLKQNHISGADFVYTTGFENMVALVEKFATLHAQQMAEKMVSERFDHLINEVSKDDDVFDKMNCLIGYLERWWNNPQSYPPVELKSVIDEAIEYLKSRER